MSSYCTFTVPVSESVEDDHGRTLVEWRDVPCAKPRVGQVITGNGLVVVVLCKRHFASVRKAMEAGRGEPGLRVQLDLQAAIAEMAATGE